MDTGGQVPVAVNLWDTMSRVMRAFEATLAEHGGTRHEWHILLNVQTGKSETQRQLATAVGINEATLTYHLRSMEERGLVRRYRDPANQRVQRIEVTAAGSEHFEKLRGVAVGFDADLRRAIGGDAAVRELEAMLDRIRAALPDQGASPPLASDP